jgi:hypothetical protein
MSQTKPHPSVPPTRQVRWRVFSAGFPRGDPRSAEFTCRFDPPFRMAKIRGELDTHSPMDCEPGVKRKMADCRLRLEAARFEAEKVVTRLLRDHEAWGQASREGRPKEKAPDARAEPRDRGEAGNHTSNAQLVCFGSLRSERNDAGAGEPPQRAPEREDTPRAHPQARIESRG